MSSPIAQLVEQMTVNHWVAGSSPAWGANKIKHIAGLEGLKIKNCEKLAQQICGLKDRPNTDKINR